MQCRADHSPHEADTCILVYWTCILDYSGGDCRGRGAPRPYTLLGRRPLVGLRRPGLSDEHIWVIGEGRQPARSAQGGRFSIGVNSYLQTLATLRHPQMASFDPPDCSPAGTDNILQDMDVSSIHAHGRCLLSTPAPTTPGSRHPVFASTRPGPLSRPRQTSSRPTCWHQALRRKILPKPLLRRLN